MAASHGLFRTATHAGWPAAACGASAKWRASSSSSSASSITPASAARRRAAGAFGMVMRCQPTSASATTATALSAGGSSAGTSRPEATTDWPSPLRT